MSETVAIHPLHTRRPSGAVIAVAVAFVAAIVFAVILLVAAVRDDSSGSNQNQVPVADVAPPRGADFSLDTCEPSRVFTAC